MELVPEDEIETSTQGGSSSSVDRRAKKVGWTSWFNCCVRVLYLTLRILSPSSLDPFNF